MASAHTQVVAARAPHALPRPLWLLLAAALLAALLAVLLQVRSAAAQSSACSSPWPAITLTGVAENIPSPLQVLHAGDGSGRLFIVGQGGTVHILKNGAVLPTPFLDISDLVATCNECGLLSIAFPANYEDEGYFFVSYTAKDDREPSPDPGNEPSPTDANDTVIARYRVSSNPDVALETEETVLLVNQPYNNHNGGLIKFGPDGALYIGMGDGGRGGDPLNRGQSLNTLLGKMLRINVSGTGTYTVPSDNPFAGATAGRDEIWSYGLRNPWRFSFDRATGGLWIADVGQGDWEEINVEAANDPGGRNYGWRTMEGNHCFNPATGCSSAGLTMPVWEYGHTEGSSVTGGYVYRGTGSPAMQGIYFFGDYGSGTIWGLRPTTQGWENRELKPTSYNISSFGEDEAGELYATDLAGGVYKITGEAAPDICSFVPMVRTAPAE